MLKIKVKEGDTLWSIAKKYYGDGSQYTKIVRENQIHNPDNIKIGELLNIPDIDVKDLIEPIQNWEYTLTDEDVQKAMSNKSYIEVILEEKDEEIERLNKEIIELKEQIVSAVRCNNLGKEQATLVQEQSKIYDQEITLIKEKQLKEENNRLNNIINKIEEHFEFLKLNSTGGNKEFFEDILEMIAALKQLNK